MSVRKIRDERHKISRKRGNGQLRRETWEDEQGKIVRYNLAYINPLLFSGDNGRVIGFDNQHGHHHRHLLGNVEQIDFPTFEKLEERFDREWLMLLEAKQKGTP
jgi:hypothetical protein